MSYQQQPQSSYEYRSPTFNYNGIPAYYSTLMYSASSIPLGTSTKIIDNVEYGELVGFRLHTDENDLGINLTLYGENQSSLTISDKTIEEWLSVGSGMAPGDVVSVGGISPDRAGMPNSLYPWVARYKTTTDVDITGDDNTNYVLMYTPAKCVPYKRIRAFFNNVGSAEATIFEMTIDRIIYASDDGK